MTFSRRKPKEPGFYWLRESGQEPYIVKVVRITEHHGQRRKDGSIRNVLADYDLVEFGYGPKRGTLNLPLVSYACWWSERLEPPTVPPKKPKNYDK